MTASPHREHPVAPTSIVDQQARTGQVAPLPVAEVEQVAPHEHDARLDDYLVGGSRAGERAHNINHAANAAQVLRHGVQSCALGSTHEAPETPRESFQSHAGVGARQGGAAALTLRACLRALPSTLAGLGFGFAHILPVLTDAGLVDCRNGVYGRTPYGQHILDEHDADIAAHAERSNALAQTGDWDKRLAAVRIAARANKLLEELKLIEADLHTLELRSTGMDAWRYRGAEVSAEHAQQLVWSVVCKLDRAGQ